MTRMSKISRRPDSVRSVGTGLGTLLIVAAVLFVAGASPAAQVCGIGILVAGVLTVALFQFGSRRTQRRALFMCVGSCLAICLAETGLRLFTVFPINIKSNIVDHPTLGYTLDPAQPDVDYNGFRNPDGRSAVDIVAIGDSHTQGLNASTSETWPQVLGDHLDASVYNMGIGGYGPLQYEVLLGDALAMKPQTICLGLYLPNDISDNAKEIGPVERPGPFDGGIRHFLKFHTAVGSMLFRAATVSKLTSGTGIQLNHPLNPTFVDDKRIVSHAKGMDLDDEDIQNYFDDTCRLLMEYDQRCTLQDARFVVLLIPSRESVYHPFLTESTQPVPTEYQNLVDHETQLRLRMTEFLAANGIEYADVLPSLRQQVDTTPSLYPNYDDGHPLPNGYRVYADVAAAYLTDRPVQDRDLAGLISIPAR